MAVNEYDYKFKLKLQTNLHSMEDIRFEERKKYFKRMSSTLYPCSREELTERENWIHLQPPQEEDYGAH